MMISPTGIKISFGGRPGVKGDSRPVIARIFGFEKGADDKPINHELVIPAGSVVAQPLEEGLYNVQLTLPSGRILQRNVTINENSNETFQFLEDFAPSVSFSLQESLGRESHNILAEAALASGSISEMDYADEVAVAAGADELLSEAVDMARGVPSGMSAAKLALGRGVVVTVADKLPELGNWEFRPPDEVRGDAALWRILNMKDVPRSSETRMWARTELPDGRAELASVPQPWFCTATRIFAPAEILVDPGRAEGAATTVAVHDAKLAGLLAYLDRGQAAAARPLLQDLEHEHLIEQTIFDKMSNSLAACAAAYVGLSAYPAGEREQWDGWLENCMRRFPGVPDAAIVHARRLLLRPDDTDSNEDAAEALRKACAAGVPYFSAGVSLLREMLLQLSADFPDLARPAEHASKLAAQVDATQAFTVLRFAPA